MEKKLVADLEAGLLSREDEKVQRLAVNALRECAGCVSADKLSGDNTEKTASGSCSFGDSFSVAKKWFTDRETKRQERIKVVGMHLTNSFEFLEKTFGDEESLSGSQEMVIFLTELSKAYHSLKFVRETNNEAYYRYNKLLLLNDRKQELKDLAQSLVL